MADARDLNLFVTLEAALSLHRAGRLGEAAVLYEDVLRQDPAEPHALYLLGTAAFRAGQTARGIKLLRRAEALAPQLEPAVANLHNLAREAANAILLALSTFGKAAGEEGLPDILAGGVDVQTRAWAGLSAFIMGEMGLAERACGGLPDTPDAVADVKLLRRVVGLQKKHEQAQDFIGTVVIPAYNVEDYIEIALDSVRASVGYFRRRTGRADARFRISIVDDGSRDATVERIRTWAHRNSDIHVLLTQNMTNMGAGFSRNMGAKTAAGGIIWFLDSDDYFFEEHLFTGYYGLQRFPQAACARTGMVFDRVDAMFVDEGRWVSEFTNPSNLCIRREFHERIGGFPEEPPFYPCTADDVCYSRSANSLLVTAKTARKTVHYTIRPGNHVDTSMKAAQAARDAAPADPAVSEESLLSQKAIELFILKRLAKIRRNPEPWIQIPDNQIGPHALYGYLPFDPPAE